MQIRRYFPVVSRFSAYFAVTMAFVITAGVAANSTATASARGQAGKISSKISSVQAKGWQSPAASPPGNGDYVFIDAPAAGSAANGTVTISGRAANSATDPNGGGGGGGGMSFADKPQVVIAMIDTGGNPYHVDFRDATRLVAPSTYLSGFPASAKAVPLCFIDGGGTGPFTYNDDCKSSFTANVLDDRPVTNTVTAGTPTDPGAGELVWYPGTRLMSKSFAHADPNTPVGIDQGGGSKFGHGSWVSSTAVGNKFGNCPECLLIILEGDTVPAIDAAYKWAAQQPWIDVITSSTSVGIVGAGINPGIFAGNHDAGVIASNNGKIFLVAAGNGAANFGLVPTSTYLYGSSSPTLIPVGASFDDGAASHWSDFPAEIMANGNDRQVAETATMSDETAVGGTSFSSPGAAGVLASSLLEARRVCKDFEEGVSGPSKTLLRNKGCTVASGPFANGILTRDELHEAFVKNAIPPYDQLSPIPGPVTWAKNAYGYVDLGNGIGNGGSTIQPLVTQSILGTRAIPARPLEQFWYDTVVREGQAFVWGSRPTVDGDGDAFPKDDGACMPDCAPEELQRFADGFAGMNEAATTYQDLFNVLGVSAQQFAQAGPAGFGRLYEPRRNVAGVIAETGGLTLSNDAQNLTIRLELAGALDGFAPAVNSSPVSYEVSFAGNHNGVAQDYRVSYEYEAIDLLGLLDLTPGQPLADKFEIFVDSLANAQGLSNICPISTNLSNSQFDAETQSAVWVIPLTAFKQSNRPADCAGFINNGNPLQAGNKITDLKGSAILTVGVVNFGNGLGAFDQSSAPDYTLTSTVVADADSDGVPDGADQCASTPAGAGVDGRGCHVALTVNGQPAGNATFTAAKAWSLAVNFSERTPVSGNYVVQASYGTATEAQTFSAAGGGSPLTAQLSATYSKSAVEGKGYNVTESPLTVNFTAATSQGDGTDKTYTFVFGDGTATVRQTEPTISHSYGNAGTYKAYVIATQDNGNKSATSPDLSFTTYTTATVDPAPVDAKAALSASFTAGNVAPAAVAFNTSGSDGTTYTLDFGDGDIGGLANMQTGSGKPPATITHRYGAPGSYLATLTTAGNGAIKNATASMTVQIVARQQLTAQLAVSPTRVVAGDTATPVTMNASSTVPANGKTLSSYTFTFDFGDGFVTPAGDATSASHVYTTPGSYEPVLTVTDKADAGVISIAKNRVAATPVQSPPASIPDGIAPTQPRKSGGALGLLLLLPLLGMGGLRRRMR